MCTAHVWDAVCSHLQTRKSFQADVPLSHTHQGLLQRQQMSVIDKQRRIMHREKYSKIFCGAPLELLQHQSSPTVVSTVLMCTCSLSRRCTGSLQYRYSCGSTTVYSLVFQGTVWCRWLGLLHIPSVLENPAGWNTVTMVITPHHLLCTLCYVMCQIFWIRACCYTITHLWMECVSEYPLFIQQQQIRERL